MEKPMNAARLPKTDSIQELAQFWDSHDLTDFEGELEVVDEPVFERDTAITLHLPQEEAAAVRKIATSKGVADAELIREWVRERVHAT
jgi:predicted DNA binding CopG/RHH family protein